MLGPDPDDIFQEGETAAVREPLPRYTHSIS